MFLRHIKNVGKTGTVDLVGGHLVRFVIISAIIRLSYTPRFYEYDYQNVVLNYCADYFGGSR